MPQQRSASPVGCNRGSHATLPRGKAGVKSARNLYLAMKKRIKRCTTNLKVYKKKTSSGNSSGAVSDVYLVYVCRDLDVSNANQYSYEYFEKSSRIELFSTWHKSNILFSFDAKQKLFYFIWCWISICCSKKAFAVIYTSHCRRPS